MTIDEAVYCMKSYLPDGRVSCQDCKYYGSKDDGEALVCESSAAHELAIKALTAQRKKGKWIIYPLYPDGGEVYMCSECGKFGMPPYFNYCPNCGAKMEDKE